MKEQMTYVAIDTDDVGESIGNAVLQNDDTSLSSISQKINQGTQIFSSWAEYCGGEVISSGSDEAIFKVPVESIQELERLKGEYKEKTGFSVSVGIGGKISDAAKALIYAKMNGKDQIIDYSPEIEMTMKQNISGELNEDVSEEGSEEEVPEHEAQLSPEDKEIHDSTEEMSDEEEIEQEELADQASEEISAEEEVPEESLEQELQSETEDEALDNMIEAKSPNQEDIDLDGRPDAEEEHGPITPQDDLDGDGDVEHEEAMASEVGEEYEDEDDYEDEYLDEEGLASDLEGEMADEDGAISEDDLLEMEEENSDMDEMDMSDMEAGAMEEEMPEEGMEEDMEEGVDHEALKQVIFESLQSFKQNREHLEQVKQQNPDLYIALIHTLQAMIEMAREMGYGDVEEVGMEEEMPEEAEAMGVSEEDVMSEAEEIPEEMEEDMESEEDEEESEDEDEENPFEKSEKLEKAKIDEGESDKKKRSDRIKRKEFFDTHEKGVNKPSEPVTDRKSGKSSAGNDARAYKEMGGKKGDYTGHYGHPKKQAVSAHKKVLGEMKNIKPNLPKSEVYKAEKLIGLVQKMRKALDLMKDEGDKKNMSSEEIKEAVKKKIEAKKKAGKKKGGKRKSSAKKPKGFGDKKKKEGKSSNDGSFCAKSHNKMRASGKDCRANEDKDSPLCSARKKMNCRGKNEEKGPSKIDKSESHKLKSFLSKNAKK